LIPPHPAPSKRQVNHGRDTRGAAAPLGRGVDDSGVIISRQHGGFTGCHGHGQQPHAPEEFDAAAAGEWQRAVERCVCHVCVCMYKLILMSDV
jgi:hypothetical protein